MNINTNYGMTNYQMGFKAQKGSGFFHDLKRMFSPKYDAFIRQQEREVDFEAERIRERTAAVERLRAESKRLGHYNQFDEEGAKKYINGGPYFYTGDPYADAICDKF